MTDTFLFSEQISKNELADLSSQGICPRCSGTMTVRNHSAVPYFHSLCFELPIHVVIPLKMYVVELVLKVLKQG